MASGIPSSRRTIVGDQAQVVGLGREVGLDAGGPVDEHGDGW